jgi:hypothetical protein
VPASVTHSATVVHSAILTDSGAIGFVASALVLAAFGMKDMVHLRIVAICSNIAFIAYALVLDLPPILILHIILLPLNGWRLAQALQCSQRQLGTAPNEPPGAQVTPELLPPY